MGSRRRKGKNERKKENGERKGKTQREIIVQFTEQSKLYGS